MLNLKKATSDGRLIVEITSNFGSDLVSAVEAAKSLTELAEILAKASATTLAMAARVLTFTENL